MNKKGHVLRIAVLALILIFLVVCGAHLGGLSHDDGGGVHSMATAIVIAVAVALVLQAASNREGVRPDQTTGKQGPLFGRSAMSSGRTGILTPLRC